MALGSGVESWLALVSKTADVPTLRCVVTNRGKGVRSCAPVGAHLPWFLNGLPCWSGGDPLSVCRLWRRAAFPHRPLLAFSVDVYICDFIPGASQYAPLLVLNRYSQLPVCSPLHCAFQNVFSRLYPDSPNSLRKPSGRLRSLLRRLCFGFVF